MEITELMAYESKGNLRMCVCVSQLCAKTVMPNQSDN